MQEEKKSVPKKAKKSNKNKLVFEFRPYLNKDDQVFIKHGAEFGLFRTQGIKVNTFDILCSSI